MKKFIYGYNDMMFKAIFCDEKNKDLLISLMECMLDCKITSIEIKNNELPKRNIGSKKRLLDLLCLVDGEYVHVELNVNPSNYIRFRNFSYFTETINNSIRSGTEYDNRKKYIHIDLTYSNNINNRDLTIYKVQSDTNDVYIDNVLIYEYNMNKITDYFNKNDYKNIEKYKYLIMLGLNIRNLKEFPIQDKVVKKYESELKIKNGDDGIMSLFTAEEEYMMELNTERSIARREGHEEGFTSGHEQGIKVGYQKGIEQGIEKGIEQGIEQGIDSNKIANAKKLYANGVSKEIIIDSLDISAEKLEDILNTKKSTF